MLGCFEDAEIGPESLEHLQTAKLPLGLHIERALGWKPKPLNQAIDELKIELGYSVGH